MRILSILVLLLATESVFAEEEQVRYRLTGLFQPDRVEDLRRQASVLPAGADQSVEVELVGVDYDTTVVTFRYDSESPNLRNGTPEQVRERINLLLQGASRGSFSVFPPSPLNPDEVHQERITVAGLDCKGCAYSAYRAIATIEGVQRAVVSFREGHVTAWIDPTKTQREALVAALKKAEVDVTDP